jgi:hypothetical protein
VRVRHPVEHDERAGAGCREQILEMRPIKRLDIQHQTLVRRPIGNEARKIGGTGDFHGKTAFQGQASERIVGGAEFEDRALGVKKC